ncbi:MAG TPA: hypothetical protein VGQ83_37650 [Polyangia bacterium]|jgi:chromosome segregation ATPase
MSAERDTTRRALGPLVAEFERLTATCRELRATLAHESAARHAVERERDQLLAEAARLGARAGQGDQAAAELRALRDERRALERQVSEQAAGATALTERCARLTAALDAAHGELGLAEEERACLEEQIRHLARAAALLRVENRLLRREPRRPGGAGAP